MSTVGITDIDFFRYENVMPNLECAKLYTYHNRRNNISVLTPKLEPGMYTNYYIRKDYDDGYYPDTFFEPNVIYGGRAFSHNIYTPMDAAIENTIPDMHIYDKYVDYYGKSRLKKEEFYRILNCAHIRLQYGDTVIPVEELKKNFIQKVSGIIVHDYNPAAVPGAYEILKELQEMRTFREKEGIHHYPIGNKFPIQVDNLEDFEKWLGLVILPQAFGIQYNGIMEEELIQFIIKQKRLSKQLYYNITYNCENEDEFLYKRLPIVLEQVMTLRRNGFRVLLKYDSTFFTTKELENMVKLINCYAKSKWQEGFMPLKQTLYAYCKLTKRYDYLNDNMRPQGVSIEDVRDSFQYIRIKNYELFKMFYEKE